MALYKWLFILCVASIIAACDSSLPSAPSHHDEDFIIGDLNSAPEIRIVCVNADEVSGIADNVDIRDVRVVVWSDDISIALPIHDPWVQIDAAGSWEYPANNVRQAVALLVDPDLYEPNALFAYQAPFDPGVLAWDVYPRRGDT